MATWITAIFLLTSISPSYASKAHPKHIHEAQTISQPEAIAPVSIYHQTGSVNDANSILDGNTGSALFTGPSSVTYDFGRNVTGPVDLRIGDVDAEQYLGLTYASRPADVVDSPAGTPDNAQSKNTVDSMGHFQRLQGPMMGQVRKQWLHPTGPGNFSMHHQKGKEGFRYLSLIHNSTGGVQVQHVFVYGDVASGP